MDRAWWATLHGVSKNWTWLSTLLTPGLALFNYQFCFLEPEKLWAHREQMRLRKVMTDRMYLLRDTEESQITPKFLLGWLDRHWLHITRFWEQKNQICEKDEFRFWQVEFEGPWSVQVGFSGGASGKESACKCRQTCGSSPCAGKMLWRRAWQPTPVSLPGESHGQRSLEVAIQLERWVWSSEKMFGLEIKIEMISPSLVNEVWEKITSARMLM